MGDYRQRNFVQIKNRHSCRCDGHGRNGRKDTDIPASIISMIGGNVNEFVSD